MGLNAEDMIRWNYGGHVESKLTNEFALLNAKNDIRKLVMERKGLVLLWTYTASNVLSVLEVAILCVRIKRL